MKKTKKMLAFVLMLAMVLSTIGVGALVANAESETESEPQYVVQGAYRDTNWAGGDPNAGGSKVKNDDDTVTVDFGTTSLSKPADKYQIFHWAINADAVTEETVGLQFTLRIDSVGKEDVPLSIGFTFSDYSNWSWNDTPIPVTGAIGETVKYTVPLTAFDGGHAVTPDYLKTTGHTQFKVGAMDCTTDICGIKYTVSSIYTVRLADESEVTTTEPTTEDNTTEEPTTEEPTTEEPTTEEPTTEEPTTEEPTTEEPTTEEPTTEEPTTEEPTEEPTTETPSEVKYEVQGMYRDTTWDGGDPNAGGSKVKNDDGTVTVDFGTTSLNDPASKYQIFHWAINADAVTEETVGLQFTLRIDSVGKEDVPLSIGFTFSDYSNWSWNDTPIPVTGAIGETVTYTVPLTTFDGGHAVTPDYLKTTGHTQFKVGAMDGTTDIGGIKYTVSGIYTVKLADETPTEEPTTEEPTSEEPTIEEPTTEEPTTEEPTSPVPTVKNVIYKWEEVNTEDSKLMGWYDAKTFPEIAGTAAENTWAAYCKVNSAFNDDGSVTVNTEKGANQYFADGYCTKFQQYEYQCKGLPEIANGTVAYVDIKNNADLTNAAVHVLYDEIIGVDEETGEYITEWKDHSLTAAPGETVRIEITNAKAGSIKVQIAGTHETGNDWWFDVKEDLYEISPIYTLVEAPTEEPTTEEPTTEEPTTEEPTTEEPTTQEPTTEEPTTAEPTTEEPTTVEPTTEEPMLLYGDVSGDNKVTANDVLLLRMHIAGQNVKINTEPGDMNGDTKLTANDVLIIRKLIAGQIVILPEK